MYDNLTMLFVRFLHNMKKESSRTDDSLRYLALGMNLYSVCRPFVSKIFDA